MPPIVFAEVTGLLKKTSNRLHKFYIQKVENDLSMYEIKLNIYVYINANICIFIQRIFVVCKSTKSNKNIIHIRHKRSYGFFYCLNYFIVFIFY